MAVLDEISGFANEVGTGNEKERLLTTSIKHLVVL